MPRNSGKEPSNAPPPLRAKFQYQKRARRAWLIVQEFGQKGGGCNDGIAKVEIENDPYDRYFIEKRFVPNHIKLGVAHKEIALLHQLSDWPGVVNMVDHFLDETRMKASVYLEYCDGRDLEAIISATNKNNRVHERKIWRWFISLMDTLVYMHRGPNPEDTEKVIKYWNFIYHRDIKPSNIFLKTDYKKNELVAKLADFGCSHSGNIAFETKSMEQASIASAGTLGYDPPEHPSFTGASDVWQLALCIASVCTGIISPQSRRFPQGQKWDNNQPAGPYYSKELNEVLSWCLTEDTKRRPMPMEISKRLKVTYERINLPLDNQPLTVPGKPETQVVQSPHPISSPGQRVPGQQPNVHGQRPSLNVHAFSDPEVQRMEHRGDRYDNFIHGQRSPMPPNSLGGRMQQPGLSGGFIPMHGPGQFLPGFRQGGSFYHGPGGYYDPRRH